MHEASLARAILQEVVAVRNSQQLGRIHAVTLELGEFSGVEPALLCSSFEELSAEYLDTVAELRLDLATLEAECPMCTRRFHVEEFQFRCPSCGHLDVQIIRGEELKLSSITAEPRESERCLSPQSQ